MGVGDGLVDKALFCKNEDLSLHDPHINAGRLWCLPCNPSDWMVETRDSPEQAGQSYL